MTIGEGFTDVLTAATAGAEWANERLYRDLSPTVCGYLRLQGAPEPEDLTSEVFAGVFSRLGTFGGTEPQFRSWVFTIAHRRLVDDRRRRSRRPQTCSLSSPLQEREPRGGDVEEDALRSISAERVRALCATLGPDQRDVLLLRMIGGFSIDQIAAVLDKTPGAVKALQRRGLAALHDVVTRSAGVPL